MADETESTAALTMDRGIALGNSVDKFSRRALHVKVGNSLSEPIPVSVSIPAPGGRTSIALSRVDYSGGTIVTSGYTTLIASTSDVINQMHIFSGTDKTLVLATGAAGLESDKLYIPPGGQGSAVELLIAAGVRVSVKAVDANPTTGVLLISYLK